MNILQKAVRKTKDIALRRSETEILVRDATNNERWGPTGTELKQIAEKTYSYTDYNDISRTLWERLEDTGKNWRHIYKALLVFDYLLKNGSDRFVQECKKRQFLIKTLQEFHYIDDEGTDVGVSIRARAKAIIELVNDEKRLKRERKLAYKNRDKYKQAIGSNTGYIGSSYRTNVSNRYSDSEEESSEEEEIPRSRKETRRNIESSEEEEESEEIQKEPPQQQVQNQPQNINTVDLLLQDDIFSQPKQQPQPQQDNFFFQTPTQSNFQSNQFFQPQTQFNFTSQQNSFNPQTNNNSFMNFNQPNNNTFLSTPQTNGTTTNDDEWDDFTGAQQQQNDIFQSQQTFQPQPIQPVQTVQPLQPLQPKPIQNNQPTKKYDEKDPWSNTSLIDLSNLGL